MAADINVTLGLDIDLDERSLDEVERAARAAADEVQDEFRDAQKKSKRHFDRLADDADDAFDDIEDYAQQSSRGITSAFGGIGLGGLAGAVGGLGLGALGLDAAEGAFNLTGLATVSGATAETLDNLGRIARGSNGEVDDVADAFRELQLRLAEANELGTGPAVDALNLLGLSLDDLNAMSLDEQFLAIRDALSQTADENRRFLADELFGGAAERLGAIIEPLPGQFGDIRAAAGGLSQAQIEAAADAQEAWLGFTDTLKDFVTTAIAPLMGHFARFAKLLADNVLPVIMDVAGFIADNWKPLLVALAPVITALAVGAVTVLIAKVKLLTKAMYANPFVAIAALIAALGVALVTAYQKSETFRNVVNGVFRAIKNVVMPIVNTIKTTVIAVWDAIRAAWDAVGGPLKTAIEVIFKAIVTLVAIVLYPIVATIAGIWAAIRAGWDAFSGPFKAAFRFVWAAIKANIDLIVKPLAAVVTAVWTAIRAGWDAFAGPFKTVFGVLWKTLKAIMRPPLNAIIGFINALVRGVTGGINLIIRGINALPDIKIPSFVPVIGGKEFGIPDIPLITAPQIPTLARGGIVTRPTLAMIGEAGPEAVMPLSRGAQANRPTVVTVNLMLDRQTLASETIRIISDARRTGDLAAV